MTIIKTYVHLNRRIRQLKKNIKRLKNERKSLGNSIKEEIN